MRHILSLAAVLCATSALADERATPGLLVVFQDSAPTDRLLIFNEGCPLVNVTLTLDLSTAQAGALLDTVAGGPGVGAIHVPQVQDGQAILAPVADGDQTLSLALPDLTTLGAVTLTLDVDDIESNDRITVDGSELAGASITLSAMDAELRAEIGTDGRAVLPTGTLPSLCVSS